MVISQYDIVLINLNPTQGSELKKTRPCVVISPDEMNRHLRTVIIAPMTSTVKPYPSRVLVNHADRNGQIALDQIRTIDKTRLLRNLGKLSKREIFQCKQVIRAMLVD